MQTLGTESRMNDGCIIHSEPAYVTGRLDELGLSQDALTRALRGAQQAVALLTENYPPITRGFWRWATASAILRDQLRKSGWYGDDTLNFATVIDPTERYAISVQSGNAYTGDMERTPTTRYDKGPTAIDAVIANRQLQLADSDPGFERVKEDVAATHQTWFLLHFHHYDAATDKTEIRAELSLPANIGTDGYVKSWRERIILDAIPTDEMPTVQPADETPRQDIPVEFKKSV